MSTFKKYVIVSLLFTGYIVFANVLLGTVSDYTLDRSFKKAMNQGCQIVDMQMTDRSNIILVKDNEGNINKHSVSFDLYAEYLPDFNNSNSLQ